MPDVANLRHVGGEPGTRGVGNGPVAPPEEDALNG